nr:retrotransposon protein, putative, Ty1-copia subclass [Tanacetum cinerariifolium]
MRTKIELTLEQSQQGVSNDVLVSIEGVNELKRNVWIKSENKLALYFTLDRNWVNTYAIGFHLVKMEILLEPTSKKLLVGLDHNGISRIMFLNHSASLPAATKAINSYSIVELVMQVCFLDAQEISPPPSRNTHPLVDELYSVLPIQLVSVYPSKTK